MIDIYIDNRERDIIEYIIQNENELIINTENLDIGDIQIRDKESGEVYIILERKTYSDLSASIKDGRYKEQKQRLLHAISKNCRKIYVLEGSENDKNNFSLGESVLKGVYINTVIRDRIMIYETKGVIDTVQLIKNIIEKVPKYIDELKENSEEKTEEYKVFKTVKKDNLTTKVAFKSILSIIPNISTSIADILYEEYGTLENMLIQIRERGENNWINMIKILSDIKHGTSQKRMGDITAKKILIYLFRMTDEERDMINDPDFGKEKKKTRKSKKINEDNSIENNIIIEEKKEDVSKVEPVKRSIKRTLTPKPPRSAMDFLFG